MSIRTAKKHTKLTNQLMENIRDLLNVYFIEMDISLVPTIKVDPIVDRNEMGIREIVEVVNTMVDKKLYPEGLQTRSRRRDLVMKRQIVSYVCRFFGFQFHHIAKSMGVNHATVIHGCHTVKNLLELKNGDMTVEYDLIIRTLNNYHNEKYGKDLPKIT